MPEATRPKAKPASPTTVAAIKVESRKMAAKSVGSRPRIIRSSQDSTRPYRERAALGWGPSDGEAAVSPWNYDMEFRTDNHPICTPFSTVPRPDSHGRQARSKVQDRRRQPQGAVQLC